jgi:hypothetical protein
LNRCNRKLEGKFLAIFSEARKLDSPAYDFPLAAFEISSKSVSVRFTISLGNYEVSHYSPDCVLARPPKDAHGAIIPIGYDAVGLHNNDRIKSGFQDQA